MTDQPYAYRRRELIEPLRGVREALDDKQDGAFAAAAAALAGVLYYDGDADGAEATAREAADSAKTARASRRVAPKSGPALSSARATELRQTSRISGLIL